MEDKFTSSDKEYSFIPTLWASRRIGHLLDLIRLNGEDKELVEEITNLARAHGIITPYTSYLIMEDEEIRVRTGRLVDGFHTLPQRQDLKKSNQTDYYRMNETTGSSSIEVSKELQALNNATNFNQTKQGSDRLFYTNSKGQNQNLTKQVKNILGRAFYQQDKYWIDSELQKRDVKNVQRIQFNSDEYYKLLNKEPQTAQYLAIGQNVKFYYKNVFYEVYE